MYFASGSLCTCFVHNVVGMAFLDMGTGQMDAVRTTHYT